jgi:nucleoside-triphosphatase
MGMAYLLTGEPGVGKTTVLKKVVSTLGVDSCGGFYTEEIRNADGIRTGFRLTTLENQTVTVADVHSSSPIRVGRYGVDLEGFKVIGVQSIYAALSHKQFVVVDEIGPMQLYLAQFKQAIEDILHSDKDLIGTIVLRSHPWADDLKQLPNVQLFPLTYDNREYVVQQLVDTLTNHKASMISDE